MKISFSPSTYYLIRCYKNCVFLVNNKLGEFSYTDRYPKSFFSFAPGLDSFHLCGPYPRYMCFRLKPVYFPCLHEPSSRTINLLSPYGTTPASKDGNKISRAIRKRTLLRQEVIAWKWQWLDGWHL